MSKRLSIRNFGPIKTLDLDILDYNVFIGPQATGKSTIAKVVYFFMSLKEELWEYVFESLSPEIKPLGKANFERKIRVKFSGFWGSARVEPSMNLKFDYTQGKEIELGRGNDGYVRVIYSPQMETELNEILEKVNSNITIGEFKLLIDKLFEQEATAIYIPAGRSILSTLPDSLQQQILGKASMTKESNIPLLDLPLAEFIERISELKPLFKSTLDEIIADKRAIALTSFMFDEQGLAIAKGLISSILKGSYRYDRDGGRIDVGDTSVNISFTSSGQQESLWVLLQLFYLILDKTKAFVIIEEPEAHLYPEAQKYITDLMALVANVNGNQLMVTTHSPYILTSLNNLIYAGQVGQQHKEKVSAIVVPALWVDAANVNAYYVAEGTIRSIMDEEIHLIKAEEIDSASQLINDTFSDLANIGDEI